MGHMGDGVDSTETNGWATVKNFTPLDRMAVIVGVPFDGLERRDSVTYSKYASKTTGLGHPLRMYYPISSETAYSLKDVINERYDPNYGMQHQYELWINQCGQNVVDDMGAVGSGIPGAPPRFLAFPWLNYLWFRLQAH